jgi:threonine dehydrogenase-like Zn-dependent dehydrogenase
LLSIGADIDESRRKRALDVGFDAVIDPAKEDIVSVVNKLTEGRGSDLSINATGATQLFIPAIKATAQGGEVSTLGGSKQSLTTDIKEIFSIIHSRHITIRGGWELQLPMRAAPAIPIPSIEDNLRNAFRWLANGSLKIDPIWTHTISPGEFKTAYDALSHKNPAYFGVIVAWKV